MKLPTLAKQPVVNISSLAKQISGDDPHDLHNDPRAYAPPDQRRDLIIDQVLKFGDLPTKELDDIIMAAENEIAALKSDAQAIRDMYIKHTTRVAEDVRRLQDEVKLSMELMHSLRKRCGLIDTNAKAANITDWQVEEMPHNER